MSLTGSIFWHAPQHHEVLFSLGLATRYALTVLATKKPAFDSATNPASAPAFSHRSSNQVRRAKPRSKSPSHSTRLPRAERRSLGEFDFGAQFLDLRCCSLRLAACGLRSLRYELGRSICTSSAERAVTVYTVQYVGRFHGDLPRRDTCAFYSITNGASGTGLRCTEQLKAAARALQSAFPRDHNQSAASLEDFSFLFVSRVLFSVINPTGQHPGKEHEVCFPWPVARSITLLGVQCPIRL
jgi:hypothetical protein